MKKYVLITVLITLISCSSFLDEAPNQAYNISLKTEEAIAEMITGAYPKASYFAFLEPRTDNVAERINGEYSRLNDAMFFWRSFDDEDLDTPLNYWNDSYKRIAQVNHALEKLRDFKKTKRVKALYAEAFLLRAYLHFMLVNIWSKHYNTKTAHKDLGIPYVTTPEKNAFVNYKRGTVKQVYEKIEKDLQYGLSAVTDNYYKNKAYHFNKAAAYAFASRFYLYKQEWSKTVAYADWVLGGNPGNKIRDWTEYLKRSYEGGQNQVVPLGKYYTSSKEQSNLLIATTESRLNRTIKTEKYGLTKRNVEKIFKGGFTTHGTDRDTYWYYARLYSPNSANGRYIDKFNEYSKYTEEQGLYPKNIFVDNVLFTTEEVLLNRAEASAMNKNYYLSVTDIQNLVKRRKKYSYSFEDLKKAFIDTHKNYRPPYAFSGSAQASLIQVIANLRQKEFVHEGLRWFDIRRFDLVIDRNKFGIPYSANNVLIRKDKRKVLQIPNEAIRQGLEPN